MKNPPANAVCKYMYITVGDMLFITIIHSNPPQDVAEAYEMVDSVLASSTQYAMCATIH
jgi:hypothetical protein